MRVRQRILHTSARAAAAFATEVASGYDAQDRRGRQECLSHEVRSQNVRNKANFAKPLPLLEDTPDVKREMKGGTELGRSLTNRGVV